MGKYGEILRGMYGVGRIIWRHSVASELLFELLVNHLSVKLSLLV